MNRIYRLIWNEATATFVAVAENARSRGKRGSTRCGAIDLRGGLRRVAPAVALAASAPALALPTDGVVSAGSASISQGAGSMTIVQSSQNAAINWQAFNIGAGEKVRFVQPDASAIVLNRVLGTGRSDILGQLSGTGQVWILNPNGVLFDKSAEVNVGGLVASTLGLSDADFMAGKRTFAGAGGNVTNQGKINADTVALLGEQVKNEGAIVANLGTVALAAGGKVTLDFAGDKLLAVQVDEGALHALVENRNLVQADGGLVVMTAKARDALLDTAVNNSGVVRARAIENREGRILLLGDMDSGTVNVGGTLDAAAPATGNGGFIETSAAHVKIADDARITTAAASGLAGSWLIDPVDFTIAASGGDMTGAALTANLAGGNVTILSTSGAAGTAGDVNVNDAVTWSANTLTLSAQNDININANLNGSGAASLALEYGQSAGNAGNTSNYYLNKGAKVSLPSGANFSTKKGNDVAATPWTVITSLGVEGDATVAPGVMSLQGMNTGLAGNYVLGADIDASGTSSWNTNAGFVPVGNSGTKFTGDFDGLGHNITGLTINRPANVLANNYQGLFGYATGALRNVGLLNSSISGLSIVGTLVGRSEGAVSYVYADGGSVTSSIHQAGGLVGGLGGTGSISNSYANVSVTGTSSHGAASSNIGGLVGAATTAGSSISNSYATGSVSGGTYVGGLVGQNRADIDASYASGAVTATATRGGLIGDQLAGAITNSYWDSATTGVGTGTRSGNIAGLTDITAAPYAQASYTGFDFAGSWRIYEGNTRPLLKSFLTPLTVTANNASKTYDGAAYSGGSGVTYSTAPNANLLGTVSYGGSSQGAVNAGSYVLAPSGLYSNQRGYDISYVNGTLTIDPAPIVLGIGADNKSKTYGSADPELTWHLASGALAPGDRLSGSLVRDPGENAGSYAIRQGSLSASGNYVISFVNGILTIEKANAVVTANSAATTYNGLVQSVSGFTATGLVNGETASVLTGVSAGGSGRNAGTYATTASGTADNYNLSFVDGTLTIGKANAVVTANSAATTYNGLVQSVSGFTATGLVNGETASVLTGVTAGGSGRNAGTYATTASGTADNYNLSFVDGTLTIGKANAVVTANSATFPINGFDQSVSGFTATGLVNGETASVLTGVSAGGSGRRIGIYPTTASGTDANYNLSFVDGTLSITSNTPTVPGAPVDAYPSAVGSVDAGSGLNGGGSSDAPALLPGLLSIVACGQNTPPTLQDCK